MFTVFQFTGIIITAALVVGSSLMEVLFTLAVCFVFNSCDFSFDWEGHMFHLHPKTSELAITAMSFALPILHALLSTICFLFIPATAIYAMLTVLEFFFVVTKRVLVYILKGRQTLSQLRRRPTQPVVVDTHNLLQPEPEQQDNAPSPATTTSSILRSAGQEATQRPPDRHVAFSVTSDTTCVYYKGLSCPLAEQETIVFKGASKLRDPSRGAIMADYGIGRISQTCGSRHVGFDPTVLAETGRVTSNSSLYLRCRILQPILEEDLTVEAEAGLVVHLESALGVEDMEVEPIEDTSTVDATRRSLKRKRSTDDSVEDASLALEQKSSKRVCLRVETASQVHRRGIKRKCSTTAEVDDAVEQESKRARICADASQVKSQVVEVSRFIACSLFLNLLLCLFSSSQSDIISYFSIHYHHVSQDLSTVETEPVEAISFEVADDPIVEDVIIAEEAPTELVRGEVEATPQAALRREVAALQSSLGPYWVPRRSSRVRKHPDYYVPSF